MSSKRRSNRKRKKRDTSFGVSKDSGGKSSFFGLVAGMTTTLITGLWVFSALFVDAPPPKKTKKRQVVLNDVQSEFDDFLENANEEELLAKLNTLKNAKALTRIPEKAFNIEQRISVANRLIEANATEEQRSFATRQLLEAHKARYGLYFLGKIESESAAEDFQACFKSYLNHTDQEIYREANLCEMTYVLFEVIRGKKESSEFAAKLESILEKFPNDEIVQNSIRRQFEACIESNVSVAKQLGEELLRETPGKNPLAAELYQYLLDRFYLIDANYRELFVNRYANGATGRRELEKKSIDLLEREDCGQKVIVEVNKVAVWLEGEGETDKANRIYESMIDAAANRDSAALAKLLTSFGESGLVRTSLIGQPLALTGTDQSGKTIEDSQFKNRIVMVLFFQPRDPAASLPYFKEFGLVARAYNLNSAPVKAIAVPTEALRPKAMEALVSSNSKIIFYGATGGTPELMKRFPVTTAPYLMLIDHTGVVSSVNVELDRFKQEIDILIDRR